MLVQTRLSILDLSPTGHQPMSTRDGRWHLVFNGEIYNHEELRAALQREGACFTGHSDTEVVLQALVRWGSSAVNRFTGMFALALWDRVNAAILVARDRFGEKPLYFVSDSKTRSFAFASEVRTLLAGGVVDRMASANGLLSFLETGSVSEPWTIVRGIWAFPPATLVRVKSDEVTADQFWQSPFFDAPSRTLRDAAPLIRERLADAVRGQLAADVPVGLFLSAGMDSSAIATLASKARGGVRSFTVSLDDEDLDEGAVARDVAKQIGCDHHDVHVSIGEAVARVPEAVGALDQPSIDGMNTYIVSKAVRDAGIVVALSGLGGDEVFAGYRTFRTASHWARLNGLVQAIGGGPVTAWAARSSLPLSVPVRKALGIVSADRRSGDFHRVFRTLFSSGQAHRLLEQVSDDTWRQESCPAWCEPETDERVAALGPVSAVSQMELDGYLRNTLLRDTDAMSMAHGLEVRAPFLDHRLVAAAASVHGSDRIAGPTNKPLLAAAIGDLPDVVRRRRKTGFRLPLDAWLRGPLRRWAAGSIETAGDGLSTTEFRKVWGLFLQSSRTVSWSRAWALVVLASWLRRNEVQLA